MPPCTCPACAATVELEKAEDGDSPWCPECGHELTPDEVAAISGGGAKVRVRPHASRSFRTVLLVTCSQRWLRATWEGETCVALLKHVQHQVCKLCQPFLHHVNHGPILCMMRSPNVLYRAQSLTALAPHTAGQVRGVCCWCHCELRAGITQG